MNPNKEIQDLKALNEILEYKDARIYYAILALDEMNSSTPQQQATILEAVKAHLIDAYSGKLNK